MFPLADALGGHENRGSPPFGGDLFRGCLGDAGCGGEMEVLAKQLLREANDTGRGA